MMAGRVISFFKSFPVSQLSSSTNKLDDRKSKSWGRKTVSFVFIAVTGGVALSALDDLAIYHACSSKAMEKARNNRELIDAIGEPIEKGPWYNASLAVAHQRQSVSCTFPISGPQGTGIFQFKAIRNGDGTWFSFFRPRDWDILIMNALLHVQGNEDKQQTLRINLADSFSSAAGNSCSACRPQESDNQEKK